MGNEEILNKLQFLLETIKFEIDMAYKDLNLIKNSSLSATALSLILAYIGYTIIKNAIIGYATVAFFLFISIFFLLNLLWEFVHQNIETDGLEKGKEDRHNVMEQSRLLQYTSWLKMQLLTPVYRSIALIYISVFLLHLVGLEYSSVGLNLGILFNLSNSSIVNVFYFISIIISVISISITFFFRGEQVKFISYILSYGFIELTTLSFLVYTIFFNNTILLSYQLWLMVIIIGLASFALMQYTYATDARTRISRYKNELSITKTKIEYLLLNSHEMTDQKINASYQSFEREYKQLRKPKLIVASITGNLLTGYAALDMKEEAELAINYLDDVK